MATSQKTWDVSTIPDVFDHQGESQERGGEANADPNFAGGAYKPVYTPKIATVGWESPNGEADSINCNKRC